MADNSEEWLKKFFNTLINNYINGNRKSMRKSEDIMEWTLKNAYPALVAGLASELCSIADILWLRGKVDAEKFDLYLTNFKSFFINQIEPIDCLRVLNMD